MYAIARRLSLKARRETARVFTEWRAIHPRAIRIVGDQCFCPLGYALGHMGKNYGLDMTRSRTIILGAPNGWQVACMLGFDEESSVSRDAWKFTGDWDKNKIDNLYKAFGVKEPASCSSETTSPAPTPSPKPTASTTSPER